MHGIENFKIIDAKQAKMINDFKNAKQHSVLPEDGGLYRNMSQLRV